MVLVPAGTVGWSKQCGSLTVKHCLLMTSLLDSLVTDSLHQKVEKTKDKKMIGIIRVYLNFFCSQGLFSCLCLVFINVYMCYMVILPFYEIRLL